jgi:oligoendopeptidase F
MHDPDREVRRQAFERWTDGYLSVADTLAETYLARVRRSAFEAEARGYASGEARRSPATASRPPCSTPPLAAFRAAAAGVAPLLGGRRRLLGVERHEPWDVFAPPPTAGVRVPYEQAAAWIVESAAPLGRRTSNACAAA